METRLVEHEGITATIKVTATAAEVDQMFTKVLNELSREMRIPGFRPGKAPAGIVEKRLGADAVQHEVRDALVDEIYETAIKEHNFTPVHAAVDAGHPERGSDFEFLINLELVPEIVLPPKSELRITTEKKVVTEDDINAVVDDMRRENAVHVPVDRPVQQDDWVLIENLSDAIPEAAEEEASEDETEPAPHTFPVDLEVAGDELRNGLIGANIGDVVDVVLTDTADLDEEGNPTLRTLKIKVHDVKEKEKPEPGDEFATDLGMENWEAVITRIRETLEQRAAFETLDKQRNELVEQLVSAADLDVPESLVNRRKQDLLQDLINDLKNQGLTFEEYLARLDEQETREEFEQELDEAARSAMRRDLVLEQVLIERGTELSNEEFASALTHLAQQRRSTPARLLKELGNEWAENYRFLLRRDKALEELLHELIE